MPTVFFVSDFRYHLPHGRSNSTEQDPQFTLDARPGAWTVRREWRDFAGSQSFAVAAASRERMTITLSDVRVAEH